MSGLFNNIANMFRPVSQVASGPMAQVNPGAGAGAPTAGTSQPTVENEAPNHMAVMEALWQNDPKLIPAVDPLTTPLFNTDPAKIAAAAGKMDFVSQVPQDLMAKAMSGTDPAAFMQVINQVAQRTLATATQLNAATVEQATSRNNERITSTLANRVKQIQLDNLSADNPVLQHAGSQPFLKMMRAQIQMKNPGMSPADINKQAEQALVGFASSVVAPAQQAQEFATASANGETQDWFKWGGVE